MPAVHLDTDIGGDMDDLCALALLLRWPGVTLAGITTVAEEGGRRAGYVRYVLALAGRTGIPVAAGTDVASGLYRYAPGYPLHDEWWPEPIAPAPGPLSEALDLLKRSVEAGASIVAIGPCTNLALLERAHPGILREARLFVMGGYLAPPGPGYPQWDHTFDYNFQLDIASARYVLEQAHPTVIPLNITVQTALRRAYLPRLQTAGPLGRLVVRQAEAHARAWPEGERSAPWTALPDDIINFQHDPLACAVALGWDGVTIEELPLVLDVVDGWLHERVDAAGRPTRVVTAVDGPRFDELWLQVVAG